MDVSELIELALALARGGCGMSVTGRRGGGGEAASWQRGDTSTQETQVAVTLSCGDTGTAPVATPLLTAGDTAPVASILGRYNAMSSSYPVIQCNDITRLSRIIPC